MRALALLLCLVPAVLRAAPAHGPLVVVLDPGHGGPTPHEGAKSPDGLLEKDVALQVALRTRALLEARGVTVVLTRDDDSDVSLAERVRTANESAADLFLSIHCNSMARSEDRRVTRGVESYFLSPDPTDAEARLLAQLENGGPADVPVPRSSDPVSGILADLALDQARSDSAAFAEAVLRRVEEGTATPSRGVRQAPFLVLSGARMPAVLVEIGFISHPDESRLLAQEGYQKKIARSLADAVREFADDVLSRRLVARHAGPGRRPQRSAVPARAGGSPVASPGGTR